MPRTSDVQRDTRRRTVSRLAKEGAPVEVIARRVKADTRTVMGDFRALGLSIPAPAPIVANNGRTTAGAPASREATGTATVQNHGDPTGTGAASAELGPAQNSGTTATLPVPRSALRAAATVEAAARSLDAITQRLAELETERREVRRRSLSGDPEAAQRVTAIDAETQRATDDRERAALRRETAQRRYAQALAGPDAHLEAELAAIRAETATVEAAITADLEALRPLIVRFAELARDGDRRARALGFLAPSGRAPTLVGFEGRLAHFAAWAVPGAPGDPRTLSDVGVAVSQVAVSHAP